MPQARDEAGNIWETDAAGNPVRLVQPAGGGRQATIIANPYRQREEGRKDQNQDNDNARLGLSARSVANSERATALDEKKFQAEQDRRLNPSITPAQRIELQSKRGTLSNLASGVKSLRDQYDKHFKGRSVSEYLPSIARPENGVFNDKSGSLSAYVAAALGLSGQQFNTPAEQKLFIGSILPNASDTDQQIEAKLDTLQELLNNADNTSASQLGIQPAYAGKDEGAAPLPGANTGGGSPPPNTRGYENDPSGNRNFETELDRTYQNEVETAFKEGASREQLDAIAAKYGAPAFGDDLDQALRLRAANPAAPTAFTTPKTGVEQAGLAGQALGSMAGSNLGSYFVGAGNAVTAGNLGNIAQMTGASEGGTDVAMGMAKNNGLSYFGGELTGGIAGALGLQRALGAGAALLPEGSAATALANPLTADTLYGGITGASTTDDPLYGFVGGAALGAGGSFAGQAAGKGLFGLRSPKGVEGLNPGEGALMNAINQTGASDVEAALMRARDLGVPATLADVSPEVQALTGSAIRRSPTVSGMAQQTLLPRSRGQIDRFRDAVSRDLGPLDNVIERSDELIAKAQADASPLYGEAYANPVTSTPTIARLLATPFGRQGLGYAEKIAANEGRNTKAMGFALDETGAPVLNPIPEQQLAVLGAAESKAFQAEEAVKRAQSAQLTGGNSPMSVAEAQAAHQQALDELSQAQTAMSAAPSEGTLAQSPGYTTQTIQYAKRGMDKTLEQYRDPINGKLVLDDLGKSENQVLRALLSEVDRVNPAFGKARSAFAGPASEREALSMGGGAWRQDPGKLGVQVDRQSPTQLEQFKLGARDSLVKGAERLRNNSNPFSTLDTPAMEQRLSTVFGNDDNIARLLAQRDLEGQLASSTNKLIGNSATAERQAADAAFNSSSGLGQAALEGAAETLITGAPTVTVARRLGMQGVRDAMSLGVGKRATTKAEQIAPLALNQNPDDTIAQILALAQRAQEYQAAKAALAQTGARPGGLVGTGVVGGIASLLAGQ